MARIILVGCGKKKLDEPAHADEMYTGPLSVARREYAKATGASWFVASAEYGLLEPDDYIAPYDTRITDLCGTDRSVWCLTVAARLLDHLPDMDARELRRIEVELHMGADYADQLRDVLIAAGFSVSWPVRGLGIGEQRKWYSNCASSILRGTAA